MPQRALGALRAAHPRVVPAWEQLGDGLAHMREGALVAVLAAADAPEPAEATEGAFGADVCRHAQVARQYA